MIPVFLELVRAEASGPVQDVPTHVLLEVVQIVVQIRHAQEQVIYALMALVCVEYIRPVQEVQIHVPIATVFAEQMLPVLPLICVLMDNARVRSDFDDSKDNF